MYPKNKDTSPSRPELESGVYDLVLVRCISKFRSKYNKPGLTLVFREIETGEEIIRTISIPQSAKDMTSPSKANFFINLILGNEEDTLELRQQPQQLAQKMIIYSGGRIFRGVLAKNERGYLDLLSIGEEGGRKMRGISHVMPGRHTLKFNGARPKFRGIHAKWKLVFHYQLVNYGQLGNCPRLILEPKEECSAEGALFFDCPPGSYSKDLAETICENINSQSGKFFEVVISKASKLVWMKEIKPKGVK